MNYRQPRVMTIPRIVCLALILLASCLSNLQAQTTCVQKLSDLPAATELLGFTLGMTKENIKKHVPQVVFGRTDDFGVSKTTINPYFDPNIDKTKFESVRSVSLDLLDDRLTSLWIGYDETFKVQPIDGFTKLVSQSLKLTGTWSTWKGRGQQLRCADFQLIVTTVAGGPSLRLLDVSADDVIAARRLAKEERDAALEAAGEQTPTEITGDKLAKVYYLATCQLPRDLTEANKIVFASVEEAEKAGFKLAKGCQ
jgi:hypothetical protein